VARRERTGLAYHSELMVQAATAEAILSKKILGDAFDLMVKTSKHAIRQFERTDTRLFW
jgi:hypothetical protein